MHFSLRKLWLPILYCIAALLPSHSIAAVKMPALFSDHMVLQRQSIAPVWGWADAGETVILEIAGQTKSTTADKKGKWTIKLDEITTSGPHILTVKASNTITIRDVLVGEVWLASGQSNMAMTVGNSNNAAQEIAAAQFAHIRTFLVPRTPAETPQADCQGRWVVCSPDTAKSFSAAAYFFGRDIHQSLNVPVGLINSSYGGTPIEAWTSMPAQDKHPKLDLVFRTWTKKLSKPYDPAAAYKTYEVQLAAWNVAEAKRLAAGKRPGYPPQKPVHPRQHQTHPANLFNGMIAPLVPYAIRGCIWYQGENNCAPGFSQLYATQLPLLIQDWRNHWNQGDFPFAWVQLPYYKPQLPHPNPPSDWAYVRESMLQALATPQTGMAITIDTGDSDNIHPQDKQPIGKRLALWAKAKVYGQSIPYSGPLLAGHQIEKNRIILTFHHTHGGLVAKGRELKGINELKGFALAGADKKWHWAEARIDGETVIVTSPQVPHPVAVRYGWADHPSCNLYNSADLPASPFRTDRW